MNECASLHPDTDDSEPEVSLQAQSDFYKYSFVRLSFSPVTIVGNVRKLSLLVELILDV